MPTSTPTRILLAAAFLLSSGAGVAALNPPGAGRGHIQIGRFLLEYGVTD